MNFHAKSLVCSSKNTTTFISSVDYTVQLLLVGYSKFGQYLEFKKVIVGCEHRISLQHYGT